MKEKILICGAGAVGVYLGTMFQGVSYDVTLYGRSKLQRIGERICIDNIIMEDAPKRILRLVADHYNYVFLATKLPDVRDILADLLKAGVTADNYVFLQNGLVSKTDFSSFVNTDQCIQIVVFGGYKLIYYNLLINATSKKWQVENTDKGKKLAEVLNWAWIPAETNEEFETNRAIKFLLVNTTNAMSAIHDKTIGELFQDPETERICIAILQETHSVLVGEYNLPIYDKLAPGLIATCREMKTHYSSMHDDILTGRKTEIDFLNGWVVQEGRRFGVETPINVQICEQLERKTKNG